MSTKATIFLTGDNEHCYTDCSEPVIKDGKYIGNQITIEFDAKNAAIAGVDTDSFCIVLTDPESEIYKKILSLQEK